MFFYDKRNSDLLETEGKGDTPSGRDLGCNDSQSLEGIRLWNESGSSLILPDEDRPVCRIYSEAFSQEIARSLSEFCIETIKKICQEEE